MQPICSVHGKSMLHYNCTYAVTNKSCCCLIAPKSVLIEQTGIPEECNRGSRVIPETIRKSRRIFT